ncbi:MULTISPECIES: LuxR C-terminal-related transcriptional regulator [unclassified Brenneria]|uniref:LuxR C-terminal-related transcriptional regulator n=1 Tax=unclassified Brenneria TaxID=2634434 RepID=UPI0029C2A234|nr:MULTISPECIES: LuxR C-terminal-related transcriptional regulator [unclassified Brenneria]MDX5626915.1 LuxR C-terminal-related transcriptional regulator [Brenneria sp. L3-3Z]MDX5693735.1 LuxR C-terminal-related transcriptional regulator [Brenneria sp. L4-2C]MEE3661621.1 LuxR C-terminal-related transcriptional regulator [Brenneria sp. g21c3]
MPFLLPIHYPLAEFVNEEPFRFTLKLPLILTKLTPPRSSGMSLQRDRLLQRLDEAESRTLTLVCAAAGFGKTTLLAQWYHCRRRQGGASAWLSLEEDDDTPLLFMRYLLEALRPLFCDWSSAFQRYLEGELPADFSLFVAELINQLHLCPHPLYLILDDYHNISHREIHDGLTYLLNHAPSSLHLIIGSRFRPHLALSRLRIQDQLAEIYDNDLRFTFEEASAYFMDSAPKTVRKQDIQRLISLTEGWIAGMKIATLSADWRTDPGCFIRSLSEGSRTLTRYLEEIIFKPLPPEVFDFLLCTAILNRLNPALCNAVTGRSDSEDMLAWIERHNLFLCALGEGGSWFRYHPLMRDTLLNRLQNSPDKDIRVLHERAGNWFAAQNLWSEAVRHTLAAGKTGNKHAEIGAQSLAEEGDIDTLVRWMRYLPANLEPSRIDLQINLAWALAHHFRFNDSRQLLDAIDVLAAANRDGLAHSVWVKLRVVRAICEAFAENIPQSIALAEPLLREVPCGDVWVDGLVCNILSYCHLVDLRPEQALNVQRRLPGANVANRNLFVEVYRAFVAAQGYLRQGNMAEAERLASQALRYAERHTGENSSSGATLAPILAEIAWEQGDVDRVDALLSLRLEMIDNFCPPDGLSRCYIVLARQAQLNKQPDDADRLLLHAEQLAISRGWSRARAPLLAERLAVRLRQRDIDGARLLLDQLQTLADEAGPGNNAPGLNAISHYFRISRSRLLIAVGEPLAAADIIDPLAGEQEQCAEWLSAVRLRIMQTVALLRAGEEVRAAEIFKPALQRAVQQKLQRSLLDAGPDLLPLLCELCKTPSPYAEWARMAAMLLQQAARGGELPAEDIPQSLSHRLTEREQQLLQLIADGYSNKGIARSLGISVETVKWHLKQVYEKLRVRGRIQAINQAREWNLLH